MNAISCKFIKIFRIIYSAEHLSVAVPAYLELCQTYVMDLLSFGAIH